jgi:hypothetical protein
MPGYGGIPPSSSVIAHTAPSTQPPTASRQINSTNPLPIHLIPFPSPPSAIPILQDPPAGYPNQAPRHAYPAPAAKYQKWSFPPYDGADDPLGWINRCEHFFRAQHTPDNDKVEIAAFHLTGVAQHWFHLLERDCNGIHNISWSAFRAFCHQRFGPPLGTNHLADLARLQFQGSVAEYQEAFQHRMAHAGYLTKEQQVQLFTGGLPEPIRTDVELQAPTDLQRAMLLARAYERRSMDSTATTHTGVTRLPQSSSLLTSQKPAITTATSAAVPQTPLRRLSPTEMAERRKKGLCYNCDEQYVRGHKCPKLFYLEVSDYGDPDLLLPVNQQDKDDQPPLISFTAITGIHHEDIMKLHVTIGNHELTALLDSGSTHNFISGTAAQHLGLHLQNSHGATVIVANGARVSCQGLARDVAICIGQESFSVDSYTIPLDCYDMILGISFFKTPGPILWDFDDMCMAFWHHGRRVLWKGIDSARWDIPSTRRIHCITHSKPLLANPPFGLLISPSIFAPCRATAIFAHLYAYN